MKKSPATGYGIRYEFGIFDQIIRDGAQVEITDKWLKGGWPWEIVQPEKACKVGYGGRTQLVRHSDGSLRVAWEPAETVIGIPHDVPVLGYHVNTCNRLRLWRAEACESFDFHAFNAGDFHGAVEQKVASETLSKVLYPNDGTDAGRRLRLKQQAFFVSCSLQDMLRNLRKRGLPVTAFAAHWAVQLNDTHPAIAVGVTPRRWLALANPPLNSLLLDVLGPGWPGQPEALRQLEPLAEDGAFLEHWHRAKLK